MAPTEYTPEELLREEIFRAVIGDPFFKDRPEISVLSRENGDVQTLIDTALSNIGAGVIVRTPYPVKAKSRLPGPPVFTQYSAQILVVSMPLIAKAKGIPTANRILAEIERILNGFEPEGFQERSGNWRLRMDEESPREDQSADDLEVRILARFTFAKE